MTNADRLVAAMTMARWSPRADAYVKARDAYRAHAEECNAIGICRCRIGVRLLRKADALAGNCVECDGPIFDFVAAGDERCGDCYVTHAAAQDDDGEDYGAPRVTRRR